MTARPPFTISQDVAGFFSRLNAAEPTYEEYTIATGDGSKVLEVFGNIKVVAALVYCIGGLNSNGTPQALASTMYIGRTRRYLLDSRASGDEGVPFIIPETSLSELQSARIYVYGDVGDKLILVYR